MLLDYSFLVTCPLQTSLGSYYRHGHPSMPQGKCSSSGKQFQVRRDFYNKGEIRDKGNVRNVTYKPTQFRFYNLRVLTLSLMGDAIFTFFISSEMPQSSRSLEEWVFTVLPFTVTIAEQSVTTSRWAIDWDSALGILHEPSEFIS